MTSAHVTIICGNKKCGRSFPVTIRESKTRKYCCVSCSAANQAGAKYRAMSDRQVSMLLTLLQKKNDAVAEAARKVLVNKLGADRVATKAGISAQKLDKLVTQLRDTDALIRTVYPFRGGVRGPNKKALKS